MKILAISDVVLPKLQVADFLHQQFPDVSLLVSCGDMPVWYLDFVGSVLSLPLFYVRGNHDTNYKPPEPGGDNLHLRIKKYHGYSFAGLEGSIRYNRGAIQYTENEMLWNVLRLMPRLLPRRMRHGYGVDVLVTHAPPRGIHDIEDDYAHRGFKALLRAMRWIQPRFLLHGHVDTWDRRKTRETDYANTKVININPYWVVDLHDES